MKEYYIAENNLQKGPFSLNELKELNITKNTLIWKNGLENWVTIDKIEELKEIIKISPPPIPIQNQSIENGINKIENSLKELNAEKAKIKIAKSIKFTFIYIVSVAIITGLLFIVYYYIIFRVDVQMKELYDGTDRPYWIRQELGEKAYNAQDYSYIATTLSFLILLVSYPTLKIIKWVINKSTKEI